MKGMNVDSGLLIVSVKLQPTPECLFINKNPFHELESPHRSSNGTDRSCRFVDQICPNAHKGSKSITERTDEEQLQMVQRQAAISAGK